MKRIAERKTKLAAITNAVARYRSRERAIVVEIYPETAVLRLLGTRTRYVVSWRGVFDFAARITAEAARAERRRKKAA